MKPNDDKWSAKLLFCSEKVDSFQSIGHVLLLHGFPEGWVIFVSLAVAEALHQLGGGIAEVQGDGREGAFVVQYALSGLLVRHVNFDRLGCSCHVHHSLC